MRVSVTRLRCVDVLQRFQIIQDHIQRNLSRSELENLHGLSMMRRARIRLLESIAEVILDVVKDDGRVVYGFDMSANELSRELRRSKSDHACLEPEDILLDAQDPIDRYMSAGPRAKRDYCI